MSDSISVAIRVKPLVESEEKIWHYDECNIMQACFPNGKPIQNPNVYTFDAIFGSENNNTSVIYNTVAKPIITSAMEGINGTIFAYGQTSSGKTFTMKGIPENRGIIPLAISDIWSYIERTPEREFLLRVSYIEIYNEVIKDLLSSPTENRQPKIHEDLEKGVFVADLREEIVVSAEQVMAFMETGEGNDEVTLQVTSLARRHFGATNMNEHSSRSHTIFRVVIESRERSSPEENNGKPASRHSSGGAVKVSCLNLVDLAGSERISQTGAEGVRRKEGAHINKSLLALGTVIKKLSQGKEQHIPYRDSKLTRILQPALGGNARTGIICTITPSPLFVEESHSTLKFASRAKTVQNKPQVNEVLDEQAMLKRLQREVTLLRKQLSDFQQLEYEEEVKMLQDEKQKIVLDKEAVERKLMEQEQLRMEQEAKIKQLTNMILVSSTSSRPETEASQQKKKVVRRETWCPSGPGTRFGFGAMGVSPFGKPAMDLGFKKPSGIPRPKVHFREEEGPVENVAPVPQEMKKEPRQSLVPVPKRPNVENEKIKQLETELAEIKEKLAKSDSINQSLEQSLVTSQRLYEELRNNLPLDVRELEGERQQLRQDIKELLEKMDEQTNQIYESEVEVQRLLEKNEELTDDNDKLRKKVKKLKSQQVEGSNSVVEQLQAELFRVQQEKHHLESLLENSSVAFKELNVVLHETRDKLSSNENKLAGVDLKEQFLRSEVQRLTNELKLRDEQLNSLQKTASASHFEATKQHYETQLMTSEIERLKNYNSNMTNTLLEYQKEIYKMQNSMTELENVKNELKEKTTSYEAQISSLKEELSSVNSNTLKLKKEAKSVSQEKSLFEKDRDSQKKEMEKAQAKQTEMKEKIRLLQTEKSSIASEKAALDRELKLSQKQNEVIKKELEKLKAIDNKTKQLTTSLQIAEKKCEDLNKLNDKLKGQIYSLECDLRTKNEELENANSTIDKLRLEQDTLTTTNADLEATISQLNQEIVKINQQHAEECSSLEKRWKSEIAVLSSDKTGLQGQLKQLEQEHNVLKEIQARAVAQLHDNESTIQQLTEKANGLLGLCEKQRQTIEAISNEKQQVETKLHQAQVYLEERKASFQAEEELLNQQITLVQGRFKEATSKIATLESERDSLTNQLSNTTKNLNQEIANISSTLRDTQMAMVELQQEKERIIMEKEQLNQVKIYLETSLATTTSSYSDLMQQWGALNEEYKQKQIEWITEQADKHSQIQLLTVKLAQMEQEKQECEDRLAVQVQQNNQQQIEMEDMRQQLNKNSQTIQLLQDDRVSIGTRLDALMSNEERLVAEKDSIRRQLEQESARFVELQQEHEALIVKIGELQEELQQMQQLKEQLEINLQHQQQLIQEQSSSVQELSSERDSLLERLEVADSRVQRLEEEFENSKTSTNCDIHALQTEKLNLLNKLEEQQQYIAKVEESYEDVVMKYQNAKQQVQETIFKELASLKEEKEQIQQEVVEFKRLTVERAKQIQTTINEERQQYAAALEQSQAERNELLQRLEALEQAHQSLQVEEQSFMDKKRAQTREFLSIKNDLTSRLQLSEQKRVILQAQVDQLTEQNSEFEKKLEKIQQANAKQQAALGELEELKVLLPKLTEKIGADKQKYAVMLEKKEQECSLWKEQVSKLEQQNSAFRQHIARLEVQLPKKAVDVQQQDKENAKPVSNVL